MDFKQASRYSVIALATIGVIGLIYQLFFEGRFGFGQGIEMTHDFGRLNLPRFFLIAWETFWLSSIAIFFLYVASRAKSGKTEEDVEKLEEFEPLLFKIVIGGLFIAALLTLLLPVFLGDNSLVQYNQFEEGDDIVEIPVIAQTFQWTINDTSCAISEAPEDSCISLQTGVRYMFLLESPDTTHGFTIYDDNNILLVQAQVVPDYVTRVAFTFEDTGDYSIRCAEYCGSAHHAMVASFTVEDGA